jgi:predicted dehydrogenase
VLRELSHEIDYALWLGGAWDRVVAIGGKISQLEIDTEDHVSILASGQNCNVVSLTLSYLERAPRRSITAITDGPTYFADLVTGQLEMAFNGERQRLDIPHSDVAATYGRMHRAVIEGAGRDLISTFREGKQVVEAVRACERSLCEGTQAGL